jgi:hypothetical protein
LRGAGGPLALVAPGLWVAVAAMAGPLFLSPDSAEALVAGRCLLGQADALTCATAELRMWPPLFPLLAAAGAVVGGPHVGPVLVSLAAGGALFWAVRAWGAALGDGRSGWPAALLLWSTPALGFHALGGDARTLALLGVALAGWAWSDARLAPRAQVAVAAAGLATAALSRPEGLIAFVVLPLLYLHRAPRRVALATALAGVPLGAWVLFVSRTVGRPAFLDRGWELGVALYQDRLPQRLLFLLFGLGAGDSPLRAVFRELAPGGGGPLLLARVLEALPAAPGRLLAALPLAGWALGAAGLVLLLRRGASGNALALGALAAVFAAVSLLPQAQGNALPASNLLLLVLAVALLGGEALESAAARLGPAAAGGVAAAAAALLGAAQLLAARGDAWPTGDARAPLLQATDWLRTHTAPGAPVAATFEHHALRAAARPLVPLPSPWEDWAAPPAYLAVGAIDAPWSWPAIRALHARHPLRTAAVFGRGEDWVLVLRPLGHPSGDGGVGVGPRSDGLHPSGGGPQPGQLQQGNGAQGIAGPEMRR